MLKFLLYAVPLVVTLYALIDAILIPGALAWSLPKWLWLVLIVVVPFFGAVAWLIAGRPTREQVPTGGVGPLGRVAARRSAPTGSAPDDDPAFLRRLADEEWSRKMRDRRRGATPDTDDHGPDVP